MFTPALDVEVEKDNVVVTADLPGLPKAEEAKPKEIDIKIN